MDNTVSKLEYPKIADNYPPKSDVVAYLSYIKTSNIFEHEGVEILYSSNKWDFSSINDTSKGTEEYKISFNRCPESFLEEVKDFAILYLKFAGKISSARKRVNSVNKFFAWMETENIYSLEQLTDRDINKYLDEQDWKNSTLTLHRVSLKLFFFYQKLFFGCNVYDDLKDCFKYDAKYDKAATMENRLPDVPSDYFDGFLDQCIQIMNDDTADLWLRGAACIIIIISQTGLRISEVLSLKCGCIPTIYDSSKSKHLPYLFYETEKRVRKSNHKQPSKTYVNDLTRLAVDTLTSIYLEDRIRLGVEYLYLGGSTTMENNRYPVSGSRFWDTYMRLGMEINFIGGFKIVDIKNKNWEQVLTSRKIDAHKLIQQRYPGTKSILLPKTHQFRVHLCTELYNKGVSLEYIKVFMGHLSPAMESYYVRPKDTIQEDMAFSQKIIRGIVVGDTQILGDTQGLSEKIIEFIENGNYNVATGLDEIVNQLSKKIPIRQKTGGVCIKSSVLRECSVDAKTNEFYCAYNVCPNIFHFFYMVDISFTQCKELDETIKYNYDNGFEKQGKKEVNMFKIIYEKKLVPEFDELKSMICKKGPDFIKREYPETAYFVDNMIEVETVMKQWKMLYC